MIQGFFGDEGALLFEVGLIAGDGLERRRQTEETRLLERYRDLVLLLTQLNAQLTILVTEQQALLKEQREILQVLLRNQQDSF